MISFVSSWSGSPLRRAVLATFVGLGLCGGWTVPATAQQEVEDPGTVDATVDATKVPSVLAQFTTAVENREPVDQVTFVSNDVRKIFFYSDLREMAGQTVTHRWIYDGEIVSQVPFEVRGPRWRVWSSKELFEDWIGDWTVEIVGGNGEVIAAETFTYSAPDA